MYIYNYVYIIYVYIKYIYTYIYIVLLFCSPGGHFHSRQARPRPSNTAERPGLDEFSVAEQSSAVPRSFFATGFFLVQCEAPKIAFSWCK